MMNQTVGGEEEDVRSAAREPDEGTPFPRDFNRGVHRRLLKSFGAHRTVEWIVEMMRGDVNRMLHHSARPKEKAERKLRSA